MGSRRLGGGGGILTAPAWSSRGGEAGDGVINFQGVEAPWLLALARKWTPNRDTRNQMIIGNRAAHREGFRTQGIMTDPRRMKPWGLHGPGYMPRAEKGADTGNGGRLRHVAWSAEMSGRGCQGGGCGWRTGG